MLYIISVFLTENMRREKVIKEEEVEIYQYGIQITMANLINLLGILAIGVLLKTLMFIILFYCVFSSLRIFCGGYHAKSFQNCFLLTMLIFSGNSIASRIIDVMPWLSIAISVLLFTFIIIKAPIENEFRPLNREEQKKFKQYGLIVCCFWTIVSFVFIKKAIMTVVFFAEITVLVLMLATENTKFLK